MFMQDLGFQFELSFNDNTIHMTLPYVYPNKNVKAKMKHGK
jgi:hypothetical protein